MSIELALLLGIFILFVLIDTPIAIALGVSSIIYILIADIGPLIIVAQRTVAGIDSFTLIAIPLFLLAGNLMVQGGLAGRIIALCAAVVGRRTGGLAMIVVIACMLFGALSGSGVADVVAIGSMTLPALKQNGYAPGFSTSLLGCAGSLGTIIPPSIVLIVYGTTTNTSIGSLFIASIIPGIFLGIGLMVVAWWISRKNGWSGGEEFCWHELVIKFKQSFLALLAPIIIIGGIRFGIFTPTEAAGIGVTYSLIVGFFIYKKLNFKNIISILSSTAETTGTILLVIASASIFAWILAAEEVPQMLVSSISSLTGSPIGALMMMLSVLLILGTFMETIAIILILAPMFMPVLNTYGIDPVYFGVLLTINLAIGANTPPLGIDLMAACRTGKIPLSDSFRYLPYFLGVMIFIMVILASMVGSVSKL